MPLEPLAYHLKVHSHFFQQPKTWEFFSSARNKNEQLLNFRTELLKNTYKFDPAAEPGLYSKIESAKDKLGLDHLPVTVYQAQYTDELNASIAFVENQAHIVLSGRLSQLLGEEEITAVLAHELSHVKLYASLNGEMETADRIVTAIANDSSNENAHYETARLFRLYTEIFCDRGACLVLGKTDPVITSLVKVATGLSSVNAEAYLKQAEEIFSLDNETKTHSVSHPENFIRARALDLWHRKGKETEAEIVKMIEGRMHLDQLDIFRQKELSRLTLEFIRLLLKPKWFRTTLVHALAKQYFSEFSFDDSVSVRQEFSDAVFQSHHSIKEYLAYVLLDFVLSDPALEEVPMGRAFELAEALHLKLNFEAILKKEMRLSDKKLQGMRNKALAAYSGVKENEDEQIYEG